MTSSPISDEAEKMLLWLIKFGGFISVVLAVLSFSGSDSLPSLSLSDSLAMLTFEWVFPAVLLFSGSDSLPSLSLSDSLAMLTFEWVFPAVLLFSGSDSLASSSFIFSG